LSPCVTRRSLNASVCLTIFWSYSRRSSVGSRVKLKRRLTSASWNRWMLFSLSPSRLSSRRISASCSKLLTLKRERIHWFSISFWLNRTFAWLFFRLFPRADKAVEREAVAIDPLCAIIGSIYFQKKFTLINERIFRTPTRQRLAP